MRIFALSEVKREEPLQCRCRRPNVCELVPDGKRRRTAEDGGNNNRQPVLGGKFSLLKVQFEGGKKVLGENQNERSSLEILASQGSRQTLSSNYNSPNVLLLPNTVTSLSSYFTR